MSFGKLSASTLAIAAVSATAAVAQSRENVQIAGSSTVLPYANIVAEAFGENFDYPTPVVESGGSSAGLRRFCEGIGENTIDIANASRAIRPSEQEACAEAGVTDIIEVRIGYDGIVFASDINGPDFAFTPAQWYNALAEQVIRDGELVDNPVANWSEVDASLPDQEILALIPGTNHGTREVFEENVILAGCEESGAYEQLVELNGGDEDMAEAQCMTVRTDEAVVEIQGDYTETLNRLQADPNAIGVFGLAFYEQNTNALKVATMSGVTPSTETIASGEYPVSRPLYFYIKGAHIPVIPGLKDFARFFVSDPIAGPNGPLAQYGLVSDPELAQVQQTVEKEDSMEMPN
ncbi:PstS family phosphate ABC transporter substrate-binding protein [Tranquillimonas alkanivorans]|uniref:Phosphate ABC transporter substrate-binding protein, PhoT family n=1 Tax=Tranquillimonas alkanivorans TaxID=441119 RepID=A0A1I5P518_9RHOB|nr:substrate-binding domain-containing protein [Tranquillimonas alkanivorans]SFP28586.1 phosphate ABC transporter substrate-binding protein, PhoT family [Tranquillimonas alkanivorans]